MATFPENKYTPKLNAVVFGGSGIAGTALISQLAATPEFERVVLILRKSYQFPLPQALNPKNPNLTVNWDKFKVVVVEDVGDVESYAQNLNGISIAFYTLGSKWKLVSREEFRRVEVDLVKRVGIGLKSQTGIKELHFLSATNTSPYSLNPISRIKAEAEGILCTLGYSKLVIYRPGYFLVANPETGKLSTGDWLMAELFDPWHWLSLDISLLGKVMVETSLGKENKASRWCPSGVRIIEQSEIVRIGVTLLKPT